jgi:hypothetical protein
MYENLTPTELLSLINKSKDKHENIKKEILSCLNIIEENENNINNKLIPELDKLEKKYVALIEELNKRN